MGPDERAGPARIGNGLIGNAVDNAACLERRAIARRSLLLFALPVRDSAVAKYSPKVGFLSLANAIAFGYRATKYQLIAKGDCYGCLYSPMLEWQAHVSPFRNRKLLKK